MMKKLYLILAVCAVGVLAYPIRMKQVEPGNVAVKVPAFGQDRGVEDVTIGTGQVWYYSFSTWYYEFPAHLFRYRWTRDVNDDSPVNEEFSFTCNGVTIMCDIGCNVSPRPDRIPHIFVRLRGVEEKTKALRQYVRGRLQDAIDAEVGKLKLEDLYTTGRETLKAAALVHLRNTIGQDFDVEDITIIGALRFPPRIESAINATIEAQQAAESEKKTTEKIKELATQAIERANGEATANETIAKSISPQLIAYEALRKWDGKLPTFMSGDSSLPFITVPAAQVAPASKE